MRRTRGRERREKKVRKNSNCMVQITGNENAKWRGSCAGAWGRTKGKRGMRRAETYKSFVHTGEKGTWDGNIGEENNAKRRRRSGEKREKVGSTFHNRVLVGVKKKSEKRKGPGSEGRGRRKNSFF